MGRTAHTCVRDNVGFGSRGTREEAEGEVRKMTDANVRRVLSNHRKPEWRHQIVTESKMGNGKAILPPLRRFMRLVEQEAHRRGIKAEPS